MRESVPIFVIRSDSLWSVLVRSVRWDSSRCCTRSSSSSAEYNDTHKTGAECEKAYRYSLSDLIRSGRSWSAQCAGTLRAAVRVHPAVRLSTTTRIRLERNARKRTDIRYQI